MKKISFIVLSFILAFNVNAQDVSVDVTADRLDVERIEGTAIFSGSVKALYKNITLTSDKLEITYDEKSKAENKIEKIIATGNVKLVQDNDTVVAESAEYYVNDNLIIFKQDVVLNRNGNILEGDHLTMDTITKKAKMKSTTDKRVKAVYFKKSEEKQTEQLEDNQESLINE